MRPHRAGECHRDPRGSGQGWVFHCPGGEGNPAGSLPAGWRREGGKKEGGKV